MLMSNNSKQVVNDGTYVCYEETAFYLIHYYSIIVYSWANCSPIVLSGEALHLTRQHYRETVLEGEDNDIFST
jgi:hypothetical protein